MRAACILDRNRDRHLADLRSTTDYRLSVAANRRSLAELPAYTQWRAGREASDVNDHLVQPAGYCRRNGALPVQSVADWLVAGMEGKARDRLFRFGDLFCAPGPPPVFGRRRPAWGVRPKPNLR